MDEARRVQRQIRAVLVVFRAERRRLERAMQSGDAGQEQMDALRQRSLELLDAERAKLDCQAAWHPRVLEELAEARTEVSAADYREPPGYGGARGGSLGGEAKDRPRTRS